MRTGGQDLWINAGEYITLTLAGQALARHAEDVIHALDRAADAVAAAHRGITGPIYVGCGVARRAVGRGGPGHAVRTFYTPGLPGRRLRA